MRLLVSMGIFSAEKNDEFSLDPMRKLLLTGTSDSALLIHGMNQLFP
jgi:hypothetical protein